MKNKVIVQKQERLIQWVSLSGKSDSHKQYREHEFNCEAGYLICLTFIPILISYIDIKFL